MPSVDYIEYIFGIVRKVRKVQSDFRKVFEFLFKKKPLIR